MQNEGNFAPYLYELNRGGEEGEEFAALCRPGIIRAADIPRIISRAGINGHYVTGYEKPAGYTRFIIRRGNGRLERPCDNENR